MSYDNSFHFKMKKGSTTLTDCPPTGFSLSLSLSLVRPYKTLRKPKQWLLNKGAATTSSAGGAAGDENGADMDPEAWLEAQSDINTDLDFDLDLDDLEDGSGDGGVDDVGSGGPEWVEGSFSSPAASLAGRGLWGFTCMILGAQFVLVGCVRAYRTPASGAHEQGFIKLSVW